MVKTLSNIRDDVELILEDTTNTIFTTTNIDKQIEFALKEIVNYVPRIVREKRLVTSGSREIDTTNIANLSRVIEAEYPISEYPPNKHNVLVIDDSCIALDIYNAPTASDAVYLFCEKVHTLVDKPSTLTGAVNFSAGYAAGSTSIALDGLGTGTIKADTIVKFTGYAGEYKVSTDATITASAATIVLTSGLLEAIINDTPVTFITSSLSPILETYLPELVAGHVALNWVGEGRTMILSSITHITASDTPIETVASRLTQASTDLASGRAYVNSVPVYSDPSALYQGFSNREVSAAVGYLNQAQGYRANASHELSIASALIRYEQWGRDKISYAITSIRRAAPYRVFHTYSEY